MVEYKKNGHGGRKECRYQLVTNYPHDVFYSYGLCPSPLQYSVVRNNPLYLLPPLYIYTEYLMVYIQLRFFCNPFFILEKKTVSSFVPKSAYRLTLETLLKFKN